MLKLVKKVKEKLDSFDITIFSDYEIEDGKHTIVAENMLIIVNDETRINIAFQVSTKPEIVASNILILKEIKEIELVSIMESFAFTAEKKLVCGKEAYELYQQANRLNIIQDFEQEKYYKMILINSEGYKC